MYQINYDSPVHVHFIGIGGISMSGLAAVLLHRHFTVTGSDARKSELTQWLEQLGAKVAVPQSADNITDDIDVVVYTAAIHPDNPEYAEAAARQIPMLSRAELLGQLMNNYELSVAVAGTHGKTTTTSMLSHIMMHAELDPTISVGGILHSIGGNVRIGTSDYFLTEACEYTNSFLHLTPKIGIVLNIDADHLDFFKDLDDIRHSFRRFAERIPADGTLVMNAAVPNLSDLTDGLACQVVTFGVGEGDYRADQVTYDENGFASFELVRTRKPTLHIRSTAPQSDDASCCQSTASHLSADSSARDMVSPTDTASCNGAAEIQPEYTSASTVLGSFRLSVPGEHNVANAAAAIAAADLLGVPAEVIADGLVSFTGTDRRFQKKGEIGGVTIIDDYAHHPTEIRATLHAAKKFPCREVWCVFQPHTYTRTKALMDEFADALSLADHVVLARIYPARETDDLGISSDNVREKLVALGKDAYYLPTFDEIENFLLSHCVPGDMVITMGAGDVVKIGEKLLGQTNR